MVDLLGKTLFKPYSNHFKGWKEKFIRMKGMDISSLVTIGADGAPRFSLPRLIILQ